MNVRRRTYAKIDVSSRERFRRQLKNSIVAKAVLWAGTDAITPGLRNQLDNITSQVADDMLNSFRFVPRK